MEENDVNVKFAMILYWILAIVAIAIIIIGIEIAEWKLLILGLAFPAIITIINKATNIMQNEDVNAKFFEIAIVVITHLFIAIPVCIYKAIKYTIIFVQENRR